MLLFLAKIMLQTEIHERVTLLLVKMFSQQVGKYLLKVAVYKNGNRLKTFFYIIFFLCKFSLIYNTYIQFFYVIYMFG